jgi:hypothetical protein
VDIKNVPVFEIIEKDRYIKIFANGKIQGIEKDAYIINRIFDYYLTKRQAEYFPAIKVTNSSSTSGSAG